MFKKANKQKLVALMAPLSLAIGLSFGTVSANAGNYVTSTHTDTVVNSYGECWNAKGGKSNALAECGDVVDQDGDGVDDSKDQCPNTPKGVKVTALGCAIDSDADGVADYLDKCPGTTAGVEVNAEGCDMVASMTITTTANHFGFDSAVLKPAMKDVLDDVAAQLNASGVEESLDIVGHTDSTGPEAYNQKLSEKRAQAVANYLAKKGLGNDMSVSGMGETAPVASNATRDGRAMNRRVEINTK